MLGRCAWARRFLLGFAFATAAGLVSAQDQTTYLTPERDPDSAYLAAVDGRGVSTDVRYVDETDRDLLENNVEAAREPGRPVNFDGDGLGTFLVVLVVAGLLFLFLKFGAGGALLRADPNATKKPRKRARAWGLTAAEKSAADILAQIRAMASRRDALILLLRHCLLQAADETETNFKRSDTEREALSRLPQKWRFYTQLQGLMFQTELVHYGGREIADDAYETALQNGARILMEAR
ncbi:hypothetical protein [Yoonia sp. SS1-5]|uniref:DUF4129 domain-containing protein n=1 Tax=Yoonia rhodophyticola TaxID=3137370 RepID=A0AAN0MBV4_9RHOB